MSRTLDISDDLYTRLEADARSRGLTNIEGLLEEWEREHAELLRRQQVVSRIGRFREDMRSKYGQMPDSADLVREDRDMR